MNAISTLIRHSWLSFFRSRALGQKLIERLLMAFIMLNIAASLLVAGFFGGAYLAERYSAADKAAAALGILLIYFVVELLLRYFFQRFPVMGIKPYLVLNIPRRQLVNSLLWRSLLSAWNFLSWFFAIPLYLSVLSEGAVSPLPYFLMVAALTFGNNYLSFLLVANRWPRWINLLFMVSVLGFLYLEFNGYTSAAPALGLLLLKGLGGAQVLLFVLAPPGMAYLLSSHLGNKLDLDGLSAFDRGFSAKASLRLFGKYGTVGELVDLELRLVARNKRARQYFLMSLIFLFFPLYFLRDVAEPEFIALLAMGWMITGMVTLNHAQLLLSWNSLHFDFLLTRSSSIAQILLAKYYALCLFCILPFVLSLPYAIKYPLYPLAALLMLLMHMSISVYVYMLVATMTSIRLDPNEGSLMSLNGFGMVHYLIVIPILLVPVAVYGLGYLVGGTAWAVGFTGALGLLLCALHKPIIHGFVKLFQRNRYRLAGTLRNK